MKFYHKHTLNSVMNAAEAFGPYLNNTSQLK